MLGRNTPEVEGEPLIPAPGPPQAVRKRPMRGSAAPPAPEPWPGAWWMLPACTLAPRSLSRSKLPVPSTKLLPLAKEKKNRGKRGWSGDQSKQRTKKIPPEGILATQNNLEDWNWERGADQSVYPKFFDDVPHFCAMETKYQGISPRPWSLLGLDILKQEP